VEALDAPLRPQQTMSRIVPATKIIVVDNQIEPALKVLKKQMLKDGLFQEMKRRVAYDKPSVKRKRKQAAARKKRRKAMRRMQRDSEYVPVSRGERPCRISTRS
jgi:small subunit ribosomal protein S21